MLLTLPVLLQGLIETLDKQVAPIIEPGYARAQLYACLDLLNNLSDKLDWKREILEGEIEGIEATLGALRPMLEESTSQETIEPLTRAIDKILQASAGTDLFDRRRELNQVLEQAIAAVNQPRPKPNNKETELLLEVRRHIHNHLRNQAIRDALYVKPMMLKKISQG